VPVDDIIEEVEGVERRKGEKELEKGNVMERRTRGKERKGRM
jgi:hypothetical protein